MNPEEKNEERRNFLGGAMLACLGAATVCLGGAREIAASEKKSDQSRETLYRHTEHVGAYLRTLKD